LQLKQPNLGCVVAKLNNIDYLLLCSCALWDKRPVIHTCVTSWDF